MPAPGANLSYHNSSQLFEMFFRKMGLKPRSSTRGNGPTSHYDSASDDGTTFPRQIGISCKQSVTAPTTNTAADAPTGKGDICLHVTATNAGLPHIAVANYSIYRCSAYTNATTFTWTQWFA